MQQPLFLFKDLFETQKELHAVTKMDGFNANFNLQNYDWKLPMDMDDLALVHYSTSISS
jgi:hypothetical protein